MDLGRLAPTSILTLRLVLLLFCEHFVRRAQHTTRAIDDLVHEKFIPSLNVFRMIKLCEDLMAN